MKSVVGMPRLRRARTRRGVGLQRGPAMAIVLLVVTGIIPAWASGAHEARLTIQAGESAGSVSPMLYGLMTEAINHSYDGGLYAELIRNRAFLDNASVPVHWSLVENGGSRATMALDPKQPLDEAIPTSLRLVVSEASKEHPAGIANGGYWGIAVRPHTRYSASFYAKAANGFAGSITASIAGDGGATLYATGRVGGITQQWKRYTVTLETGDVASTSKARFLLSVDKPGTVWFSLVSLFPPTWDNQPNGFRKDIMQMLVNLKPRFLRFPGGNFLEGSSIAGRFDWKKTIGPLRDRPGHWGPWGYRSTDGMGLLEFLLWCQDMNAQPVLALYAGYSLDGHYVEPGPALEPYVKSALEEIQYVTGPVTSTWGKVRAADGHPAPFELHYVEIGNEDFFDRSGSYDARFQQFYRAIKAAYPDIKIISTIGNEHAGMMVKSATPDVLDQHYYEPADWFETHAPGYFKGYDRKGPKIFVGEWASYETPFPPWNPQSQMEPPTPDMKAALGDAAWMAAMERNSDLVIMQCYAPLLVNVSPGARQWRPDLIGYDALHVYGSPSYYAIRMFSTNLGNQILAARVRNAPIQTSVTRDSANGTIFVKLINPGANAVRLRVQIEGVTALDPQGTAITLSAPPDATNSIEQPTNVVPVDSTVRRVGKRFDYDVPAHAIVVLKLRSRS